MSVHEQFYDVSPVKAIDQNKWDLKLAEVQMQFQGGGFVTLDYTPLDARPGRSLDDVGDGRVVGDEVEDAQRTVAVCGFARRFRQSQQRQRCIAVGRE